MTQTWEAPVADPQPMQDIIQLLGSSSPALEEEVAALASVLHSWAYQVVVAGPLSQRYRRRLGALGIRSIDLPAPNGASLAALQAHARATARLIREWRPLLVHAHGIGAAGAGVLARRGQPEPPPVVVSPHFLPHLLAEDARVGLRRLISRRILRRCGALVVGSETQRDDLARLDRASAERATLVPAAIDQRIPPDSLDLGRRRRLLGMTEAAAVIGCAVDNLAPSTLALFLDAARELCMAYPSLEFALIGSDVDHPPYHNLAHVRSLLGATVFIDPHDRFLRALSALNVLVIPQRGWPAAILALQALSQDVGVVATPEGEVAELLMGSPGVTIAADHDPAALSRAIIEQLRAAAGRMPRLDEAVEAAGVSPFLVSRDFYDLSQAWDTPAQATMSSATPAHRAVAAFDPMQAARALIAVYHRVIDAS